MTARRFWIRTLSFSFKVLFFHTLSWMNRTVQQSLISISSVFHQASLETKKTKKNSKISD